MAPLVISISSSPICCWLCLWQFAQCVFSTIARWHSSEQRLTRAPENRFLRSPLFSSPQILLPNTTCGMFLVTCGGIGKVAEPQSPAVKLMRDSGSNFMLISVSTGSVPRSRYANEITRVCFCLMFGVWSESDLCYSATTVEASHKNGSATMFTPTLYTAIHTV